MYTFKQFTILNEGNKNTHLEHIEDELINQGAPGVEKAFELFNILLNTLSGHTETAMNITTKWDGAPAIFAGTDPADGKFFVGTKAVFGKIPKMNKRISDIDKNHKDVRRGESLQDKSSLRKKLKIAFKALKEVGIDGYVVQGDMLYIKDMIKSVVIDGEKHIAFKPNTITYTVPEKSDLAKEMLNSTMGIVFHTLYTGGPTIHDLQASFGFDASKLIKSSKVWFDDANFKDVSGQVNLTVEEQNHIRESLRTARNDFWQVKEVFDFLHENDKYTTLRSDLKVHINGALKSHKAFEQDAQIFASSFISKYIEKTTKEINSLKTERGQLRRKQALDQTVNFLNDNRSNIEMMYDMYLKIMDIKLIFVDKLSRLRAMDSFIEQPDGSFVVTKPEGFVAVDHIGGATKLVDRIEFAVANFDPNKKFG